MPEKAPLIFLKCSAKKKEFANGGSLLSLGIKAEDLTAFIAEHTNERGYVNLTIKERREVGRYGDTHAVTLDTWVATPKAAPITESDIPF
jgi:hypothetical protein|tara:strand:+ start:203 stop:472 length:270 start_codon:yes stop_codon:yes gene_type:complete